MRTTLQKVVGGYRSDLPHTADLEIWLRCAARAPVGIIEADQAFKRMHRQQHGGRLPRNRPVRLEPASVGVPHDLPRTARPVAGCDRLRQIVERGLAKEAFWAATAAFDLATWRDPATCSTSRRRSIRRGRRDPSGATAVEAAPWSRRLGDRPPRRRSLQDVPHGCPMKPVGVLYVANSAKIGGGTGS